MYLNYNKIKDGIRQAYSDRSPHTNPPEVPCEKFQLYGESILCKLLPEVLHEKGNFRGGIWERGILCVFDNKIFTLDVAPASQIAENNTNLVNLSCLASLRLSDPYKLMLY